MGRASRIAAGLLTVALMWAGQFVHHRLDSRLIIAVGAALIVLCVAPELREWRRNKKELAEVEEPGPWMLVPGRGSYRVAERLAERLGPDGPEGR
jgi:hypothetical protein